MMRVLARILKDNTQIIDRSVHFVITKAPALLTPEELIKEYIKPFVGSRTAFITATKIGKKLPGRTLLARLSRNELTEEEIQMTAILDAMSQHPERILIPDISDSGRSRQMLDLAVSDNLTVGKENFDFSSTDGTQETFNEFLGSLADEYLTGKQVVEDLPGSMQALQNRIDQVQQEIVDRNAEILEREKELLTEYDPTVGKKKKLLLQKKIKELEEALDACQEQKQKVRDELMLSGGLKDQLKEAKKPEPHVLYSRSFSPSYSKGGKGGIVFTCSGTDFKYTGLPFTEVKPICSGGGYTSISSDAAAGKYEAHYDCNGSTSASANVTILTTRDRLPEYQKKIEALIKKIEEKDKLLQEIDSDILDSKQQTQETKKEINQIDIEEGLAEARVESRNARLKMEIESRRRRLLAVDDTKRKLTAELTELKEKFDRVALEIRVNMKLFETIYDVIRILGLKEGIFGDFQRKFPKRTQKPGMKQQTGGGAKTDLPKPAMRQESGGAAKTDLPKPAMRQDSAVDGAVSSKPRAGEVVKAGRGFDPRVLSTSEEDELQKGTDLELYSKGSR
jgi:hypothetical protein